jgi:hypothetical protein
MQCPACSSTKSKPHTQGGVVTCAQCGALYTTRAIYKGDSLALVLAIWDEAGACAPGDERYFDLEVLGSQGLARRHGWFNPVTRRITQVG